MRKVELHRYVVLGTDTPDVMAVDLDLPDSAQIEVVDYMFPYAPGEEGFLYVQVVYPSWQVAEVIDGLVE